MGDNTIEPSQSPAEFSRHAETFRHVQASIANEVGKRAHEIDSDVRTANSLMLSVLASVLFRQESNEQAHHDESSKHIAAIIAEFAKSIAAFEFCIHSGLYGAAATLLRREIEAINNCNAHRRGKQKDKHNPRIKAFENLSLVYKKLTGIAHNSDRDSMLDLVGGSPANLDPMHNQRFAEFYLMTHIQCTYAIALEASSLLKNSNESQLTQDEKYYAAVALGILTEKEFLVSKQN